MHVGHRHAATKLSSYAMQHGSPPIIYSAGNAASPAVENGADAEPLQMNAARHKTYSESELAEMETGMLTTYSL